MFNSPKDIKAAVTKLSQMTDYQLFLLVNKLVNKIKIAENLDLAITFVHFLMWYESVKSGFCISKFSKSNDWIESGPRKPLQVTKVQKY